MWAQVLDSDSSGGLSAQEFCVAIKKLVSLNFILTGSMIDEIYILIPAGKIQLFLFKCLSDPFEQSLFLSIAWHTVTTTLQSPSCSIYICCRTFGRRFMCPSQILTALPR